MGKKNKSKKAAPQKRTETPLASFPKSNSYRPYESIEELNADETYRNNPYNFVPLCENVFERYKTMDDLPRHDHYEKDLLSGEIQCTFRAETPICVSDGASGFFKGANKEYMIPGSSIKGLVRTNMMTLGFGAMRPNEDFDDYRLLYRIVADSSESVRGRALLDAYKAAVGKEQQKLEKVQSGYLVLENGKYYIYQTSAPYIPVKRNNEVASKWANAYASQSTVWYRTSEKNEVVALYDHAPDDSCAKGILVCPGSMGKPTDGRKKANEPNHLYLFPEYDPNQICFEWSKEDVIAYKTDYEVRENVLGGTNSSRMDKNFWKLPDAKDGNADKPWPIFFLEATYGGVAVGRNPYLRIGYKHTFKKGLPKSHIMAGKKLMLDYPWAMLGFSYVDKEESCAYRSRVSFGDFTTDEEVKLTEWNLPLGSPKPSSIADYVMPNRESKRIQSYNDDNFQLRGIKQYWLKEVSVPEVETTTDQKTGEEKTKDFISTISTVQPQTSFTGKIRFRNLAEDELGLLLWCLCLDKGCYQSVGAGKPYGFGRMSVTIDSVSQFDFEQIYCAGKPATKTKKMLDAEKLIDSYISYMRGKNGVDSVRENHIIRQFFFMHQTIRDKDDVRYMTLGEYQNRKKGLPLLADELYRSEMENIDDKQEASQEDLLGLELFFQPL